tara:strand:+ start:134 stop:739 length:606 start_codon:yes stop_codon:yes gene_type:complete
MINITQWLKHTALASIICIIPVTGFAADFHKGFRAYDSGDYKAALAEWTPLAEQGLAQAQYWLGRLYSDGEGVPENDKIAVKWFTKAAEQGDAGAQAELGFMYYGGEGVPKNNKTAAKWHTKAAEQGNFGGQFALGLMYEYGEGVLTNNRRAYMWYSLAKYNGDEEAGKYKDGIAKQMTPADISKAQDMSSRCLESNYTDC